MAESNEIAKKVRRNPFIGTWFSRGKSEFEARMGKIDKAVAEAMIGGVLHTVDFSMYATRYLGADTTIELMQSSDTKKVGITNVNNRKLEASTYAFFTGMQLLAASPSADTEEAIKSAEYGKIDEVIAGGELEIKQGDKILYPRSSNEVFRKNGGDKNLTGYIAFDCAKIFIPMTDIIPTLYLPKAYNPSAETPEHKSVRIIFHGIKTNKA